MPEIAIAPCPECEQIPQRLSNSPLALKMRVPDARNYCRADCDCLEPLGTGWKPIVMWNDMCVWYMGKISYKAGIRTRKASERVAVLADVQIGTNVQITYEHGYPHGIRDNTGYLILFTGIHYYEGQEQRFIDERKQKYMLANYLLACLQKAAKEV